MNKVYIVEHQINARYELPITNIEHTFDTYDKAVEWLEKKKSDIENKTSYHFNDRERGWLNPIFVDEYSNLHIHIVKLIMYRWTDTENGKLMYTQFKILEYDME